MFLGHDGFQDMFVYQPKFNTLELKKIRALNILLAGNQKFYLNLDFFHWCFLPFGLRMKT